MAKKVTKKVSGKKESGAKAKPTPKRVTPPKRGAAKVAPKPDKTTQQEVRRIRPDNPKVDKNADGKPDEARESMTKVPDKKPKGPQWSKPNEVIDDDPLGVQGDGMSPAEIDNDVIGRPNDRVQNDEQDEEAGEVDPDDDIEPLDDDDLSDDDDEDYLRD